jgi:hypothetical protein
MMNDPSAESMGGDTHAHRTARTATREHLWAIHAKLRDMADIPMWHVYAPPFNDYPPDTYVAQLFRTRPKLERLPYCFHHEDLDRLREMMPPTCTSIGRSPDDDPQLIEVWV